MQLDHHHEHEDAHRFPLLKFSVAVLAQVAALIYLFYLLFPNVFLNELSHPWGILFWTIAFGIPSSLFEYLYHRYLLHSAVLPFLGSMHDAHDLHHGLTSVKAPVTQKEPAKLVPVKNQYPIEKSHQEEAMMFPLYTATIFIALFVGLLGLPLKFIFPGQPIILSFILGVMVHYSAYEIWHAVLHLPFDEFWRPRMESPTFGRLYRHVYGFHLMHHWRPVSNLAVVGFWGLAIWDHMFRTHHRPDRMPLAGAEVSYEDASLRKPLWPISQIDRWQGGLYRTARRLERFISRIFMKRATE